jgi:hypothetical protein
MTSAIYIKTISVLLGVVFSIFLALWLIKKINLNEKFSFKSGNRLSVVELRKIDSSKSVAIIALDSREYALLLAEHYCFLLDGGEGRIRTYERARRADLQSAAFGHSATSPEPLVEEYDIGKKKKQ